MGFDEDYAKVKEILKKAQEEKLFTEGWVGDLGIVNISSKQNDNRIWGKLKIVYEKRYGDKKIKVIQEVRDRDKTFMPRPDGIKMELIIEEKDRELSKEEFGWIEKAQSWESDG